LIFAGWRLIQFFFFYNFAWKAARQASGQDTLKTAITASLCLIRQIFFSGSFTYFSLFSAEKLF
jgi:hypothetical protein